MTSPRSDASDYFDMAITGLDYEKSLPELKRLTRPGGVLITGNLAGRLPGWDSRMPTEALTIVRPQFSY